MPSMLLASSPSSTRLLLRASARPAARTTARGPRPLLPPAAARACRGMAARCRAANGDDASNNHGDDDDEESEKAKKNESGGENSTPPSPPPPHPRRGRPSSRDTARALEALRGPSHQKIGAEYGEGFVQFRAGAARPLSLDVDALNERLSPSGALRLRRALVAPDEAHGALFSFEGVIADTRAAQAEAWRRVSLARALAWPPPEVTLWGGGSGSSGSGSGSGSGEERSSSPSLSPSSSLLLPPRVALVCSLRPERAITEVLQWTRDYGLAGKIAAEVAYEYLAIVRGDDDNNDKADGTGNESEKNNNDADGSKKNRPPPFSFSSPRPGVARWLSALRSARVPSTVVTSLDRETLLAALERMGLLSGSDGILLSPSSFVTAEDGAESLAQSLLAGALKLGRPPNACCAFVASPAGVAAAHNASMRAVAVSGAEHSAHELRSADATVSRLDELRVIQVRRLFSSGGAEGAPGAFMGKQKERAPGAGGGTGGDGSWFDPDADAAAARRQSRRRRVAGGVMDPPPPPPEAEEPGGGGGGGRGGRGWGEDDDGGDWRRRR